MGDFKLNCLQYTINVFRNKRVNVENGSLLK